MDDKDDEEVGDNELDAKIDPELDEDGNEIINEDENKHKEPQNPLKLELIIKSLKKLSKTYNGLSYAYIQLDLKDKELDEIGEYLTDYRHLRDINLSNNKFSHITPVQNSTYLVRLDASKNEIKDLEIFTNKEDFQFLQILNLKENKIKQLPELFTYALTNLNLETNLIDNCSHFQGLPHLKKLYLNQNKIKNCDGLANMPNLEVLYLNENIITSLKGLENLENLRKLRIKTNKIQTLLNEYIPFLPNLKKLNISDNKIKEVKQFSALRFPKLEKITVDGNPFLEDPNAGAKIEILIQLEEFNIKSVNKEEVTSEDIQESIKVKEERIIKEKEEAEEKERIRIQEEQERKQKEDEERAEREREELEKKQKDEEERQEREAEEERRRQEDLNKLDNQENLELEDQEDMEGAGVNDEYN